MKLDVGAMLRHAMGADPSRPALHAPAADRQLSRGQLAALAARLLDVDPARGPLVLHTADRMAQAAVLVAGLMAGRQVCPLDPSARGPVVERLLAHARATTLVDDREAAPGHADHVNASALLHDLPVGPPPPGGDGAGGLLVYTSGTTGAPKGVGLAARHLGANVAFAVAHFGYGPGWVSGSVLPLFHTFTVVSDLLPVLVGGGEVVIAPGFGPAHVAATAQALRAREVRSYSAVPVIFDVMLATRFPLPSTVRFAIAGAAPLGEHTRLRHVERYGHEILPCYGLSESTCFAAASRPGDVRAGTVGKPAGIEIQVRGEDGGPLAPGMTGEVALRGPSVIDGGYHEDGGQHRDRFPGGGWFLTGDLGRLDGDGFLSVTGRKKNMLIRGGEKVYLEDVDRCLAAHPAVVDCCTVRFGGGPHEDGSVAFVVCQCTPVDTLALGRHVTTELGLASRVDRFVVVDEIPRSPSGKALREVLVSTHLGGR